MLPALLTETLEEVESYRGYRPVMRMPATETAPGVSGDQTLVRTDGAGEGRLQPRVDRAGGLSEQDGGGLPGGQ